MYVPWVEMELIGRVNAVIAITHQAKNQLRQQDDALRLAIVINSSNVVIFYSAAVDEVSGGHLIFKKFCGGGPGRPTADHLE